MWCGFGTRDAGRGLRDLHGLAGRDSGHGFRAKIPGISTVLTRFFSVLLPFEGNGSRDAGFASRDSKIRF